MIDPTNITNYNRTESELEEFILFCVLVAGKNSKVQANKLEQFLAKSRLLKVSPFDWIKYLVNITDDALMDSMKQSKLGQYSRLEKTFKGLLKFKNKLSKVTVADLESIEGIGPKTARFFLLHTRPKQKFAVLDTHVLRWMRSLNIDAPLSTPRKGKYAELEKLFLIICEDLGFEPAKLDLLIWNTYSFNGEKSVA